MPFSPEIRREAMERAHWCCALCHQGTVSLEVHHIIEEAKGGLNTIDNACPVCPNCHANFGANDEKRTRIRWMRDWWWNYCAEKAASPEILDFNRQLAEFRGEFKELKDLLYRSIQYRGEEILGARNIQELDAASGVSLPATVPITVTSLEEATRRSGGDRNRS